MMTGSGLLLATSVKYFSIVCASHSPLEEAGDKQQDSIAASLGRILAEAQSPLDRLVRGSHDDREVRKSGFVECRSCGSRHLDSLSRCQVDCLPIRAVGNNSCNTGVGKAGGMLADSIAVELLATAVLVEDLCRGINARKQ